MDRIGYAALVPQNFKAYNRGDMFVPSRDINPRIHTAAMIATPKMGRPVNVHAIPLLYTQPKANVRTQGAIGMRTPNIQGSGLK